MSQAKKPGFRDDAVSFVCPECNGPLYETREGKLIKFNCQIGHSFSLESLTEGPIRMRSKERFGSLSARSMNALPFMKPSRSNSGSLRTLCWRNDSPKPPAARPMT